MEAAKLGGRLHRLDVPFHGCHVTLSPSIPSSRAVCSAHRHHRPVVTLGVPWRRRRAALEVVVVMLLLLLLH